jgi:hypothetical protein
VAFERIAGIAERLDGFAERRAAPVVAAHAAA